VSTGDPNKVGNYQLELLIKPNGLNSVGTVTVPYTVKILGCNFDTVQVESPIGAVVYQVKGGLSSVMGSFSTLYRADCTHVISYTLV